MKLMAIGFLGSYAVYVDLSREEAIKRYDLEHPHFKFEENGLTVREIEVKDNYFWAYDISEE